MTREDVFRQRIRDHAMQANLAALKSEGADRQYFEGAEWAFRLALTLFDATVYRPRKAR